ncbi:hypothetical protein [Propionivibrio dicarboxylicus]|uniref:hypothetical protein n=1 Tax=Propionivibrio dicarboxylicus TaxID=83767 RepID=UPI000B8870EE|nr:hypothetical protein [Propionivibrio dicarboxylicus]
MNTQKIAQSVSKKQHKSDDKGGKATAIYSDSAFPAKRRRLARAFSYPLDDVIRRTNDPVRERFLLLKSELDSLIARKKQLVSQGVEVKKSDLVRLGLQLLKGKTDGEILILLSKLTKMPDCEKK